MNMTFSGCSSLTSLDLSNFDTSSVTSMGSMFHDCSNLASLDISKWDRSKADVGGMFNGCSKLTITITIRNSSDLNMFYNTATEPGAKVTLNYTSSTLDAVDQFISSKPSNTNIVKGKLVS